MWFSICQSFFYLFKVINSIAKIYVAWQIFLSRIPIWYSYVILWSKFPYVWTVNARFAGFCPYNNMYPLLTKVCNEIAFSKPLKTFQKVCLMHVLKRHNVIVILPTSMGTIWYFKWLHLHCKRSSNWLVQFVKFWHPYYIFFISAW